MSVPQEREAFDPVRVSASRLNAYVACGVAFKKHYIDGEQPTKMGSSALFGNVVHRALEKWCMNRSSDLLTLMREAWLTETAGTVVNEFVGAYASFAPKVIRAEKECKDEFQAKNGRPTSAVRMTKCWKQHAVKKQLDHLFVKWLPRLDKESPWRFSERDPFPALYNESLVLARRYQARWGYLPPALYSEFGFDVKWRGFILKGYIDAIEPLMARVSGELLGLGVIDYKTYGKPPMPAKDWRQRVFYDVALEALRERGDIHIPPQFAELPVFCGMDYVRWEESWLENEPPMKARDFTAVSDVDREKFYAELCMYRDGAAAGVFLPADKYRNPDFCDYPEDCCMKSRGPDTGSRVEVAI